ncbi:WxL protein host-binding domain-containing protein, partial [Lactococcus lactis]
DTSLKFNLNKAISGKQAIKIPAKTSKKVSFQLSIPKNGFPGIALGGINVVQVLDKTQQESGMSIRNQYAYVIGLKLQEKNRATVKPDLKLVNVKAKQIDYQNYVTARLQNPRPEIIHGLKIRSYITAANSNKKVYITNKKDMAMA